MNFERLFQGRRTEALSPVELEVLNNAVSQVRECPAGTVVVKQGVPVHESLYLVSGTVSRNVVDASGRRHMMGLHFGGDFIDLHAFPLRVLDHNLAALTDVSLAVVPHERLTGILKDYPDLTGRLWFLTLLDAAMHRQWSFRLSSLSAPARLAHFLCETNARLIATGVSDGRRYPLSMTQAELGEACGLTNVHVNRVLRGLREQRLCTFRSSVVEIHDLEGLAALGEFTPDYLYLDETINQQALGLIRSPSYG
ncbi:MAG: Crp/Fnr family transcriptional regulator [Comamonadaceae bacterium]|nr:MAG: Crp/Fnr family transcriptional regulator [Comamonadaceae bacterium]